MRRRKYCKRRNQQYARTRNSRFARQRPKLIAHETEIRSLVFESVRDISVTRNLEHHRRPREFMQGLGGFRGNLRYRSAIAQGRVREPELQFVAAKNPSDFLLRPVPAHRATVVMPCSRTGNEPAFQSFRPRAHAPLRILVVEG